MAATSARMTKLAKAAAELGWTIQGGTDGGYRIVDTNGTQIAANWSVVGGYGLTLDDVERAIERGNS